MEIKTSFNPIGAVVANIPGFSELVDRMKTAWGDLKAQIGRVNWTIGIQFLTRCLDDLVVYLVHHEIPGQDKKATVLAAIGNIYDKVVSGLLPIWLRPFSGLIKSFVINMMLSHAIDLIVEKYNNGSWSPKATTDVLALWGVPGDHRPS